VEKCFTLEGGTPQAMRLASKFGFIVEWFVKADYCLDKGGCSEFISLPASPDQVDFFDENAGTTRCRYLASYLKFHNPGINEIALATLCEARKDPDGSFPVPDIITHSPPLRLEFYELKPNSASGKSKGRKKLGDFHALTGVFSTAPYVPGDKYDPDRKILVWDGTWFTVPTKVRLHFFRLDPGLLLYELCVEVSAQTVNETVAKLLIKMVVAALILVLLPVVVGGGGVVVLASNVQSPMNNSVGAGGANAAADVIYVQRLLNDWRGNNNLAAIGIDGLVGQETIGAIHRFQTDVTGIVDDRVDPNGQAIHALERLHLENAVNNVSRAEIPDQSTDTLLTALNILSADPLGDDEEPIVDLASTLQNAVQDYFDDLFNTPL
jgi:hypothetical protein